MSLRLSTKNLTKRFAACTAVEDVSVEFEQGRIHAILGENGAGKSTFMKLLFGLYEPTEGEIRINDARVDFRSSMDAIRSGLGMVQQHFTLVENLTAIDNIILGAEPCGVGGKLNREGAIKKLESLLPSPSLAVPWTQKISQLTIGQKQRVEILKLLFREAKVLFLDEPTAVLAPAEIDDFFSVLRDLKKAGRTIFLITHKINEVLQVCDTYCVLRQGKFQGKGEVAGASTEQIVERMIGQRLPEFEFKRMPTKTERALICREVANSSRELNGITLNVGRGEIVGIAGVEGSGQGPLVDAILNLSPFSGQILVNGKAAASTNELRKSGLGLIPEDRIKQGLWLEESCFTNMIVGLESRFVERGVFQKKKIEETTSSWAREFDVRAGSLAVASGSLSGGNQQKIIFAREVCGREPNLLICHQPTRGVDLGAIDLIHRKIMNLRNEGLGVLILSSELEELLKLSDRIYVLFNGRVSAEYLREDFDLKDIGASMTGANRAH